MDVFIEAPTIEMEMKAHVPVVQNQITIFSKDGQWFIRDKNGIEYFYGQEILREILAGS